MIDNADLAIIETHLDDMNPVERGLVEELRRARDELEAHASLQGRVEGLEEEVENLAARASDAEEELSAAERARDEARDLAEERAREIDDLRSQLAHAERREDEMRARAEEAERALSELKTSMRELLRIPSWVDEEPVAS